MEVKIISLSVLSPIEILILTYSKIVTDILIIKNLQKKIKVKINKIFN